MTEVEEAEIECDSAATYRWEVKYFERDDDYRVTMLEKRPGCEEVPLLTLDCLPAEALTLLRNGVVEADDSRPDPHPEEKPQRPELTPEQQERYYKQGRCPSCDSDLLGVGVWDRADDEPTQTRDVFCEGCDTEFREVHYRDCRVRFLEPV